MSSSLAEIIAPHVGRAGGLISALRAVQADRGFLPSETEAAAADAFNLTKAEVKGVVSFYSDFRSAPAGETVVRVCAAEACQAVGGRALASELETALGVSLGETREDRAVTLEPVYCLGLCSCAPAALVGERLVGRADKDRVLRALEAEQG